MLKEIDEQYWNQYTGNLKNSLFLEPDFLNVIAGQFGYKLHYFVYEEKNEVSMVAALYSDGSNIVAALPYIYSSISFISSLSDRKYLLICREFIRFLKLRWKNISLRLPVEITDVRPFIWEGFKISNRYTYLKDTDSDFNKKIIKISQTAAKEGMWLDVIKPETFDIRNVMESLKRQIFNAAAVQANLKTLTELVKQDVLLAFRAYMGNECVCTSVMLVDSEQKKAYALLISDSVNEFAHVYINFERIGWCFKNNIQQIDLCGANEPGIANFKSALNGTLAPYFIVYYNPTREFWSLKINAIKKNIKRILKN